MRCDNAVGEPQVPRRADGSHSRSVLVQVRIIALVVRLVDITARRRRLGPVQESASFEVSLILKVLHIERYRPLERPMPPKHLDLLEIRCHGEPALTVQLYEREEGKGTRGNGKERGGRGRLRRGRC